MGLLSKAKCAGLKKGTSSPKDFPTAAIPSSSVVRITLLSKFDANARSAVYPNNGLPAKDLIFFPGTPLDPPLAGIIPIIFI